MTRTQIFFTGIGLFASLLLVGCEDAPVVPLESPADANAAQGSAPPAKVSTIDGRVVIAIPAKLTSLGDGLAKIHALGSLDGKNFGCEIDITNRAIMLHSVGANSDALLDVLARAYEATPPSPHIRPELEFPIEFVEGDLRGADRARVKMRTKIDTGLKSEYAEIFITFDATRNALQIEEEDPSFRTNVVRAFSQ